MGEWKCNKCEKYHWSTIKVCECGQTFEQNEKELKDRQQQIKEAKEKLIKELQNSLPLLDNLVYWEEKYNQEMILHKPERTHKNLLLAIQNFVDRKENKS